MTKLQGVLKKSPLEGGVLLFEADNGEKYQLENLPAKLQKENARLEVEGKVDKGVATIGMIGPVFSVSGARAL